MPLAQTNLKLDDFSCQSWVEKHFLGFWQKNTQLIFKQI